MKIWRVHALGGIENLVCDEVPAPVPGPHQVRIRVRATGVNFADSLIIAGKYQEKPDLPFGPGAEVCGEIVELGERVEGLRIGERIMALTRHDGYAEEALVSAALAQPVPPTMSDEAAAGFPIVYGTSHIALWHKARLQPGETLVVHGAAGGVGLTAVEIGKALGARVIATASTAEKLEIAKARGADEGINSREEDLRVRIKALTDGRGADVIYDPIGGEVFDASLRAINFEGRILTVGFAGGTVPQIPANLLLVKTVDVLGLNWPAYQERRPDILRQSFAILMDWFADGTLTPLVSKVFDLDAVPDAIAHVANRKATGKVVVRGTAK
ncbi:MAG: NADPH:quinone oxidoreductase family protein [Pseudomonadota bacterium]